MDQEARDIVALAALRGCLISLGNKYGEALVDGASSEQVLKLGYALKRLYPLMKPHLGDDDGSDSNTEEG